MKSPKLIFWIIPFLLFSCSSSSNKDTSPKQNEAVRVEQPSKSFHLRDFPNIECDSNSAIREEVKARHIVVELSLRPDETEKKDAYAKAVEARDRLLRGESFSVVETQYSVGAYSRGVNDGDLGFFKKGVMVKEFEELAFCLPVNTISPVFSTDFGFHILEVTAIKFRME